MTEADSMSALQERFAREEGVSLEGLRGEVFDSRYAFRRDPYTLIAHPHEKFDAGRLRDHIDTVEIRSANRFSNSLCQLANSVALANLISCNGQRAVTIRTPGFWYLPKGMVNLFDAVNLQNSNSDPNNGTLTIKGNFFYLSTLKPMFSEVPVKYVELQRIAPHISIPDYSRTLSEDDLVIHLRSGDVFVKDGEHPEYGQPPLAYYQKIVASKSWQSVHMVFEDKANVVIEPLIELVHKRGIPLSVHSGTLESDLSLLMAAKTLVAGIGTFVSGVAAISRNLRTIYAFERFHHWGNKELNVIRCEDATKSYVSAVLSANWKNLPAQRQLMLSYPDENIVIPSR